MLIVCFYLRRERGLHPAHYEQESTFLQGCRKTLQASQ